MNGMNYDDSPLRELIKDSLSGNEEMLELLFDISLKCGVFLKDDDLIEAVKICVNNEYKVMIEEYQNKIKNAN